MKRKLRRVTHLLRNKKIPLLPAKEDPEDKEGSRITNETVAEHREQVLSRARRYIYPLQHSKHRIVIISITLFIAMVIGFFTYCTLALYRFQSSSAFLYRVTQVIPFPIARTGGKFVAYENYLFELRRYMHYYQTQQELDFKSEAGQRQLNEFKRRALDKVINDAYIKQLAAEHNISVSDEELEAQIDIARKQNRFGNNEEVFEDTLKNFLGWSINDFKRSLRQQMLAQKLVASLDAETTDRAKAALAELKQGTSFAKVAKKYSDDVATKEDGGDFGVAIDRANRDLTAQTTAALFSLAPGQHSEIINIGYALEIVQLTSKDGSKVKGAHILFNFKEITTYINDLKEKQPTRAYFSLPEAEASAAEEPIVQP